MLTVPVRAATMSSSAGAVTTGGGSLYVRSAPGGNVLTSLKKGSYVTLISKSGSWWKVEYAQGKYGYCHADYITAVDGTPAKVNTGGDTLNVRAGPGTAYSRIDQLQDGQTVLVRSAENGWNRILYNGVKLGYVSGKYLSGNSIALSVPSYKQTDRRWSNYPLGTKGGTIGTIGCAVTGIAMLESYRSEKTIYPNQMAMQLSFTSGGGVYWPDDYTAVTTYSPDSIYKLLKQGKPVLLGAKNAAGGQHWVVITGFTGGNLTAENFTVNDSGSSSRTNLQQVLSAYPVFYKYFYY